MFNSNNKRLLINLSLICLGVLTICLVVDAYYRKKFDVPYPSFGPIWIYPTAKEKYQIIATGNSHAQTGIQFSHYNLRGLNFSSVAQRFSYDYAMLQQHSRQIEKGAVIIIPVTPISFSHRPVDRQDTLQANYYNALSPFLIPQLNTSNYLQMKVLPFLRSGYLLRKENADTIEQRIAQENKSQFAANKRPESTPLATSSASLASDLSLANSLLPGELWGDQRILFPPHPVDPFGDNSDFLFHKWVQTDEFNLSYVAQNRNYLKQIIQYSLDQGWKPVLITIPIAEVFLQKLPEDYMEKYLYEPIAQANEHVVPYFDFSKDPRFTQNYTLFGNADHLNPKGAHRLSYVLLQKLIEIGYVHKDANGYEYVQ